jgi:hypothetical protein
VERLMGLMGLMGLEGLEGLVRGSSWRS